MKKAKTAKTRSKKDKAQPEPTLRKRGRPPNSTDENGNPLIADSIRHASGITGLPASIIKAAKDAGCSAFKGSRVIIGPLLEWVKAHPLDETQAMGPLDREKFRKLRAEADMKTHQLQIQKGLYVLTSRAIESNVHSIATAKSVMEGKRTALAMVIAAATGADPNFIAAKIEERDREVCTELTKRENYKGAKCGKCGEIFRL